MNVFKRLQASPGEWLLSALATVIQTARRRSPNLIYKDKDKHWINAQRGGIFVNSSYSSVAYADIDHEARDIWCFYDEIRPGDIVIDIGAGIGDHAVVLSKLIGAAGRLIAIEAHPQTFACLEKCIRLNNLHNVEALNVAVSDSTGTLYISDFESHVANRVGCASGIAVAAKRLDDILDEFGISEPTLIKINIEGSETAALRGATRTLEKNTRWIISCHDFAAEHDPALSTYADVTRIFSEAGLSVRDPRVDARPWIPFYVYAQRQ